MNDPHKITLSIGRDEAYVLFELLADLQGGEISLDISPQEAHLAISLLQGALESTLIAPLQPNYKELLEEARRRLRERAGGA
jgi:hypothetical protein